MDDQGPSAEAIISDRLALIPMPPAFLRASLAGDTQEAARLLSRKLPQEWPGEHRRLLSLRLEQLDNDPLLQPWLLRAMSRREDAEIVGHIGFHSAPGPDYLQSFSPSAVEFGFTVYPPFRRQGYAREAAISLMRWATEQHGISAFVMTIRPSNLPSQALARQIGFVRIASHTDEIDGVEDVLEYRIMTERI